MRYAGPTGKDALFEIQRRDLVDGVGKSDDDPVFFCQLPGKACRSLVIPEIKETAGLAVSVFDARETILKFQRAVFRNGPFPGWSHRNPGPLRSAQNQAGFR